MRVEEFFYKYKKVCSMYNCNECPLNGNFSTMCLKTNDLCPDDFTFDNLQALILKIEEVLANNDN